MWPANSRTEEAFRPTATNAPPGMRAVASTFRIPTTADPPCASDRKSVQGAVAEVHDTIAEAALLQQLQRNAGVPGKRGLAVTDEDRIHDQVSLIDQPGVEGM